MSEMGRGGLLILPMGLYKTLQTSFRFTLVHPTASRCELNHYLLKLLMLDLTKDSCMCEI